VNDLSVDGRLRRAEDTRKLVEAFRRIGLDEEADELERTGRLEGEDDEPA
jgi:hypothetical protein